MNFIGILREKKSTEKSDINLLGMNFFDSRTFLIYRSVPQRNPSALWAKKFWAENRDIPFLLTIFFETSHLELSEILGCSWRSFSVLWDQKIWRKIMIWQKVFEITNILKIRSGHHEFFRYCETKNIRQKNLIFRSHA